VGLAFSLFIAMCVMDLVVGDGFIVSCCVQHLLLPTLYW